MERIIYKAELKDLQEILDLQYLAYQSEANLFGNRDIPPLKQTIEEVINEYNEGVILKMLDDNGAIIGSVRAKEQNGTVYIGKLMVHPDHRGHGYGTKLLKEIELYFPKKRYELFTSTKSLNNIYFYQKLGYKIFNQKVITDELQFVYMEKTQI
ncbi:acyl-CoA N-acyltransferase [Neocallimastix lanati (nom. inval.)]|jgi:GNAT superfamily N-acetyltransferase|uniref:Acyl-CoA N-acyltransferase n=1 Tax=Neocallimastix californiae TaxID=1754190 RepID=A0A1Y1ZR53_9FUNG|nr:acyl-CoA N-acyltransferase [Neocallimastix sp. JGI-2020a]ORY12275.1 acyl-CoA N-acyltransferase [Neocallimastix californiae]|eukprot:ORY12275.1 acyl-CoA N-acyltransferase [Neocallimastix californiae]